MSFLDKLRTQRKGPAGSRFADRPQQPVAARVPGRRPQEPSEEYYMASSRKLIWRSFKTHKLGLVAGFVLLCMFFWPCSQASSRRTDRGNGTLTTSLRRPRPFVFFTKAALWACLRPTCIYLAPRTTARFSFLELTLWAEISIRGSYKARGCLCRLGCLVSSSV